MKSTTSASPAGKRYMFLINPISGRGKGRIPMKLIKAIDKKCRAEGVMCSIRIWDRPDRIHEILAEAVDQNYDALIAAGGDGTINLVGGKLAGTPVALGIIPKGSGNGFARHLGISRNVKRAVGQLLRSTTEMVDTATFGGLPFMNVAGIGFDAEVAKRYSRAKTRGIRTYVRMGVRVFVKFRPFPCRITVDGTLHEYSDLMLLEVANGTQWGGGAKIAPGSSIADGWLEAIVVEKMPVIEMPGLLSMIFQGNVHRHPRVTVLKGKEFIIERSHAGNAHIDGEFAKLGKNIECRIHEKNLKLLVPVHREEI